MSSLKTYTAEEVSKHNNEKDCWIIIQGKVYDVTNFLDEHPGGKRVMLPYAGKDATKIFSSFHSPSVLTQYGPKLLIGEIKKKKTTKRIETFGDGVPFGDPYWYQGYKSPFYKETHLKFRQKVRDFVEKELMPYVHEWDEKGTYPRELHEKAYKAGIYAATWPKEYGGTPPEDFDAFHDFILIDELSRCAAGGVLWSCFWAFGIALPPILNVGSDYLKNKVARDVITGKKIMSLAITEPYAGSDVANIQTTARREGDYYIVNGEKKFITAGGRADYITTAVRTGGEGLNGVSLLLIERDMPGVTIRRMKTQGIFITKKGNLSLGWWSSTTTFIKLENVRVPIKNLIGRENDGFRPIMKNFNHERFVFAVSSNRFARVCMEEAIKYARVRMTFGKRLIDHPVIRHKIAEMTRLIESTHAMAEQICYQYKCGLDDSKLGGPIALLKVQATKTFEFCAREASQILGGASCIRGGPGEKIERLYREVRQNAIAGGSEEILMDLAMRRSKL